MRDEAFRRWAGRAAILSAPLALASLVLPLGAVDYDLDAFTNPSVFLGSGSRGASLLKWSMVLDIFGYYLLIAPLVMVLGRRLEERGRDWSRLLTACLLGYVMIGAAGAAVLAAVVPKLILMYPISTVDLRPAIELVYGSAMDAVYGGLWNILEEILAGVGWLGFGWLVRRDQPRAAGLLTMALGVSCLLDAAGTIGGWPSLASTGLYAYLILAPAWAVIMGILLLPRRMVADTMV